MHAISEANETEKTAPKSAKKTAKKPAAKPARVAEQLVEKKAEPAASKSVPPPTVEVTKSMVSKCARAFRKAGKATVTEAEVIAFANSLIVAGVKILSKSSSRIARCVQGEIKIEHLK
jgi:hypothetical protein